MYKANKDAEKIRNTAEQTNKIAEQKKAEAIEILSEAQKRIDEADQYAAEIKSKGEKDKERLISEGIHSKRKLLSTAQKESDEMLDIAGRKADRIISNAQHEADEITKDAHKVRDAWQDTKSSVVHDLIVDLQLSSDRLSNYKNKNPNRTIDSNRSFTQEYKQSHKNKNHPSL